jgi:molybdopterin molybdotransferase
VFTGAPVPEGADTVIRQEHATRLDPERVQIDETTDAGKNVRSKGDDIAKGSIAIGAGTEIRAAQLGVLSSIAQTEVAIIRAPHVALLATGDELASLDEADLVIQGRKIASSNSYAMLGMVREERGLPLDLGIARDKPAELRERLTQAALADLIVTSGGMSVGEHDHLRDILSEQGDTGFWRLRTRPGAPVGFGQYSGTPWIGLPGNPVSTMVAFELFVRPAIRRLSGHRRLFRRAVPVRLAERAETPGSLTHFLRVTLGEPLDGLPSARLTGSQSSGVLSSMAKADALVIVPEDTEVVESGTELPAIVLNDGVYVEEPPY